MVYAVPTKAKGFTLIELAVVIAVIAILAGVGMQHSSNVFNNGQRARAQAYLGQLKSAVALYTSQNSVLPANFTQFVSSTTALSNASHTIALLKNPNNTTTTPCTLAPATITCGLQGTVGVVTYTYQNGEIYVSNTGTLKL